MQVTLLGSGDATGVPAALCDCEYCRESDRRRHPGLLVETRSATLVFDCGPDVAEQLREVGVTEPDAFFLTHAHGDHSGGIPQLAQAAKWDADHLASVATLDVTDPETFATDYAFYLTETAREHVGEDRLARLDDRRVGAGESVAIGDARIAAFPVEHHRPAFDTLGFTVTAGDTTIGYAPDMRRFAGGPPDGDLDLFVCEGAAVLGRPVHGPEEQLRSAIDAAGADRTVLVNVSEHLQRAHTDVLRERAARLGRELGRDFRTDCI
jgi:ribonuclease BN (tRNA processing enzyme)